MWEGATIRKVSLDMRAAVVRLNPGKLSPIRCLNCKSELTLCQPDIEIPDQLVGTCKHESAHSSCSQCKSLHLIGIMSDFQAVIMLLPSTGDIHEAILQQDS